MSTLLEACLCGSTASEQASLHGIPVLTCKQCGVIRQDVKMTPEQLGEWYRDKYFAGVYQHSYGHDRNVAARRLAAYQLPTGVKVLDIGAGLGAFVHEARECGVDAWGQDIATRGDGPYVYAGERLEDVAFPTDEFDVITIHDVLEHFVDPVGALLEVRRILKPGGKLIVDFPRFWHEAGLHHWKLTEHLWMLTEEQLVELLKVTGFVASTWTNPIPSKFVMEAERVVEQRPQILVPAGIGDAYWVLVKLRGFLKKHGLGLPDVWVQEGGPRRTEPFLRLVPFIHAAGYYQAPPMFRKLFHEAYMLNGRTVYSKTDPGHGQTMPGIDWFIAYNGILRHSRSLQDVDPEFGCEWYFPMHFSKTTRAMTAKLQQEGPYMAVYLTDNGLYGKWWAEFGPRRMHEALKEVQRSLGLRMVFVGAEWDRKTLGEQIVGEESSWLNLISKTSYEELAGVLRGAACVFGWPSGATLVPPAWHVPTFLVWNQYFKRPFWTNSVPPDAKYKAVDSFGLTPEVIVAGVRELVQS